MTNERSTGVANGTFGGYGRREPFTNARRIVAHCRAFVGKNASGASYAYRRARPCFSGSQAPFCLLLSTDCWMKYIPSTPSLTFG